MFTSLSTYISVVYDQVLRIKNQLIKLLQPWKSLIYSGTRKEECLNSASENCSLTFEMPLLLSNSWVSSFQFLLSLWAQLPSYFLFKLFSLFINHMLVFQAGLMYSLHNCMEALVSNIPQNPHQDEVSVF